MLSQKCQFFHHYRIKLFYVRNIHFTPSTYIRGASNRKKISDVNNKEEYQVAGEFYVDNKPKSNINDNFYGIEGDEGVIHFDQSKFQIPATELLTQNFGPYKQKISNTRFGAVRFDRQNKATFYGSFGKNPTNDNIKNQDFISNMTQTTSANIASSAEQKYTNSTDFNSSSKSEEPQDFINELYFERDFKQSVEPLQNSAESFECATSCQEDMTPLDNVSFNRLSDSKKVNPTELDSFKDSSSTTNYFDEQYFNAADFKESASDTEHILEAKEKTDINHIDENITNRIDRNDSFIDQVYFKDKPEHILEAKEKTDNINHINENITNRIDRNDSFIDQMYFKDKSEATWENKIPNIQTDTDIDKSQLNDNFLNVNISKDPSLMNRKNTKKNVSVSESISNDNSVSLKDSFKKIENETISKFTESVFPKNYKPSSNFIQSKSAVTEQQKFTFKRNITEHEKANEFITAENSHDNVITSRIAANDRPETIKTQESKVNKQNEATSKDDPKLSTAYDLAKKIRSEKKNFEPELKNGKFVPRKDKLDSKGFRILKHQVPNLKYYTRDEIVEFLKNNILYSDDDVVVLNKPYNLVMHESETVKDASLSAHLDDLAAALDKESQSPKLITVHRLDKETCGCLLLARNEASAQMLTSLFLQRKIMKTYWIVTIRVPEPLEGIIDIPIAEGSVDGRSRMVLQPVLEKGAKYRIHCKGGKRAVSEYKVISTSGNAALIEVKPVTGIKHQIRVHFGFGLSCPILGDHKYSYIDKFAPQKLSSDLLHRLSVQQSKVRHIPMHIYARSILIPQYKEGRNLFVTAPMPVHISQNLQRLKFRKN